jgi:hypothetical protein
MPPSPTCTLEDEGSCSGAKQGMNSGLIRRRDNFREVDKNIITHWFFFKSSLEYSPTKAFIWNNWIKGKQ